MKALSFCAITMLSLTSSGACTHERLVTAGYSAQVPFKIAAGSICRHGEIVGVETSNRAADPRSAGTTAAGIHTFNYRFDADPALALKRGLEESLQAGGCRLDGSAQANLFVQIVQIEARGEKCGMWSCPGTASARVAVTLSDRAGHPLLKKDISAAASGSCGMVICNDEEASRLASSILSDTITKTVRAFAEAIAKQLAPPPAATSPASPQDASPTPGAALPSSAKS